MKSEKGITLTSLVAYIAVFMIILSIMTMITNNFLKNVSEIKEPLKGISEFNKFSMFFIKDVKANKTCTVEGEYKVEFADGTMYTYNSAEKAIYRNELKIAENVEKATFTMSEYTQEIEKTEFTKNIIKVNMILGIKNELIEKNIDFVLKYW